MVEIRLRFKPNRRVMRAFTHVVKNDIERLGVLSRARQSILLFWETHIYDFFNARVSHGLPNTGQLGKSLRIEVSKGGNTLNFFMVPLHNTRTAYKTFSFGQFKMPSYDKFKFQLPSFSVGLGRNHDTDYGKLLREGFSASHNGYYDFRRDCKIKPGYHPGYDATTRWIPWKRLFDRTARKIIVRSITNELSRLGVNIRRIKI